MKTKTGKKVTALLAGVLLLGVTAASVFAAPEKTGLAPCCDTGVMAKMGIAPQQIAKLDTFCIESAKPAVKGREAKQNAKENSARTLKYDYENGRWVEELF